MTDKEWTSMGRFTERARKVLELSLREALSLGHSYVGTEHLLLGLVREGEGMACQVLEALGVTPDMVRDETIRHLSPRPRQDAPTVADRQLEQLADLVAEILEGRREVA